MDEGMNPSTNNRLLTNPFRPLTRGVHELTDYSSLGTFVKQFIRNPRAIGAAFPSSRKLANKLASFVSEKPEGLVVELGAGTGSVTAALLERGIDRERIVVIERSVELCELLKKRFPELTIIHGDARFLKDLLSTHLKNQRIDSIVSCLPLRSLPKDVVLAIEAQINQLVCPKGRFIQFTYDLRPDIASPFSQFERRATKVIWQNLPPARVDMFQRKSV
jgi:phosphatidylethanolamine/phosphatidyl-N-methylethanolamine N-methyltransferase